MRGRNGRRRSGDEPSPARASTPEQISWSPPPNLFGQTLTRTFDQLLHWPGLWIGRSAPGKALDLTVGLPAMIAVIRPRSLCFAGDQIVRNGVFIDHAAPALAVPARAFRSP